MSEWIKCSERMPAPNQTVLTHKKGYGHLFVVHKNNPIRPWEWIDGDTCHMKITHWMPLPPPPHD